MRRGETNSKLWPLPSLSGARCFAVLTQRNIYIDPLAVGRVEDTSTSASSSPHDLVITFRLQNNLSLHSLVEKPKLPAIQRSSFASQRLGNLRQNVAASRMKISSQGVMQLDQEHTRLKEIVTLDIIEEYRSEIIVYVSNSSFSQWLGWVALSVRRPRQFAFLYLGRAMWEEEEVGEGGGGGGAHQLLFGRNSGVFALLSAAKPNMAGIAARHTAPVQPQPARRSSNIPSAVKEYPQSTVKSERENNAQKSKTRLASRENPLPPHEGGGGGGGELCSSVVTAAESGSARVAPRAHIEATVVERLACSPPTKAIHVQSPAGPLRIFACGNRAGRCRWSAGFLGVLSFPPPFQSCAAPYLTSYILIGSEDLDINPFRPTLIYGISGETAADSIDSSCTRQQNGITGQENAHPPFANQRLVSYPAAGAAAQPVRYEHLVTRSSQADTCPSPQSYTANQKIASDRMTAVGHTYAVTFPGCWSDVERCRTLPYSSLYRCVVQASMSPIAGWWKGGFCKRPPPVVAAISCRISRPAPRDYLRMQEENSLRAKIRQRWNDQPGVMPEALSIPEVRELWSAREKPTLAILNVLSSPSGATLRNQLQKLVTIKENFEQDNHRRRVFAQERHKQKHSVVYRTPSTSLSSRGWKYAAVGGVQGTGRVNSGHVIPELVCGGDRFSLHSLKPCATRS
ncbi:hypothetical protein PR048_006648 [Dryococelus australis]|uniref:Uncharacterized protein n=1 Tax=Dryococelus australis TaxID=614101 RepID=A0ABQ9IDR5_9NEOP|nr:hypothetical protein PR048_006648 [Dryococelus australis]